MSFMREIEDALAFSKKLNSCLRQKTELAPLYEDYVNEQMLHADRTKRFICSIPMPPPMQALQYEYNLLREQLGGVFTGVDGEKEINTICVRIASIRMLHGEWLREELEQMPELFAKLAETDFGFDVGAKWQMVIFENLPKPVLHTTKRK